jgi:hypothetical protein
VTIPAHSHQACIDIHAIALPLVSNWLVVPLNLLNQKF